MYQDNMLELLLEVVEKLQSIREAIVDQTAALRDIIDVLDESEE